MNPETGSRHKESAELDLLETDKFLFNSLQTHEEPGN